MSETISLGDVGGTRRSGRRSGSLPSVSSLYPVATVTRESPRIRDDSTIQGPAPTTRSRCRGAQLKKLAQTERSFLGHPCLAQPGEESGLVQGADLWHPIGYGGL